MARQSIPAELVERLRDVARTPVLLVACDYDGTLAPIVDVPDQARPVRESSIALRGLAALPSTHVAVISGRTLRDLAALSRLPEEIHLVGSHGSEFDLGFAWQLGSGERELLGRAHDELAAFAARGNGLAIESKPASVALHYRRADPGTAREALDAVARGPASWPGIHVHHGKKVVELGVVPTNKGNALEAIRRRLSASSIVFVGDDVTDEDGFAVLRGPDVSVKVGEGPSSATYRVRDEIDVSRMLALLLELREAWLRGVGVVAIEHHSLLSDGRSVALVAPDARLVWLCHPRPDSPAWFADLVGGPSAGYFAITSADGSPPVNQRYVPATMIVRTRFPGFDVLDYLDCSGDRTSEPHGLTDLVRVMEGHGRVHLEFAPRVDFGRIPTGLKSVDDGLEVLGSAEPFFLFSPAVHWNIANDGRHQTAIAEVDLDGRGPLVLELRMGSSDHLEHPSGERVRRADTSKYWTDWLSSLALPATAGGQVRRSAVTLKALCQPSGAILAAATTSLPETIGGVRNWDYRYCWIRDAAMVASALVELGSSREALAFLDWLSARIAETSGPERLAPLYAVNGAQAASEAVIDVLSGYAGSRPVHVGNAAVLQIQADVFGPVVELIYQLVIRGEAPEARVLDVLESMVLAVERRWHEPDHGIWEVRLPPRHHVFSKVMCWVAVDRGIKIRQLLGHGVPPDWLELRDRIARDVLIKGWNEQARAFTIAYGFADPDAASLFIGLSGLVSGDDERFIATVAAVERVLRRGPTVYRYRSEDGLPGIEGGFHLCTGWLIESYLIAGRVDDAIDLFERLISLCGPTGMLSEQYDPVQAIALGNHPQAYSHLAVVRCATRLAAAGVRDHAL